MTRPRNCHVIFFVVGLCYYLRFAFLWLFLIVANITENNEGTVHYLYNGGSSLTLTIQRMFYWHGYGNLALEMTTKEEATLSSKKVLSERNR
ncbi:hypothetical protein CFP56_018554 [Quercus suber]|uniref:Transmembrane protein n=1 Tax=Quercus suber TaxID=58331 RepID=A0AAW0M1U6_QUESU